MSITEIAIKRPLLVTTAFVALVLFGIISYTGLNYNLLPSFQAGVVSVVTVLPGASPEDIENSITKPIEDAISTVEGIDVMTSTSKQNVSSIIIKLKPGVSDKDAQQDVERKINQIRSELPTDANESKINRFGTDNLPILNLTVSGKISDKELYDLVDKKFRAQLSNVKGVGDITLIGGQSREIEVRLDNQKLQYYKLSPKQVYQVIAGNRLSFPAGDIENENARLTIRLDGNFTQTATINSLVIKDNGNGSRVLLSDIATVSDAQERITTINRFNGKNGIGLQIYKTNDANAVSVSTTVKEKLTNIENSFSSKAIQFEIASDQSTYTLASADAVMFDLILAVLIVSFVMLMFLHSLRSSFFVLIAIPSAIIPTFIMMSVFGFSLNLLTLLGLSLVVGILVDDSIVVLENITRHLEMGKPKRIAALTGRNEIGFTAIAITMVDVVVFLPMAFTGGLIGNILREFSLVVVTSTLMSLLVSFTLTPLLASRWGKIIHLTNNTFWGRISLGFESFLDNLKNMYGGLLHWILFHKRYIFILVIVLIVSAVALIPTGFIGASFTGTGDRGQLSIQIETTPDMPVYQTNLITKQAEELMLKHPEVETVYTLVGTQSGAGGGISSALNNISELSITLNPKTDRTISTDQFGVLARYEIEKIPGVKVTVIPTSITGATSSPIQIVVKGTEVDSVYKAAEMVRDIARNTAGSDYVKFSTKGKEKQIKITPDRQKIAQLGLTLADVAQSVQLAFNGNNKIEFNQSSETYKVNVGIQKNNKQSIGNIRNLALSNNRGELVFLYQVANIEEVLTPSILERTNRMSSVTVTSSAVGRPSGNIVSDIQSKISSASIPAGVEVSFQGDAKDQKESFASLAFALILAIVLVYMVMVSLYESVVYPFVVIFSIPVALIGALLAIALTMNQLTIFTIIGMIMLLGLVTKNGILIVDFTNHLKSEGLGVIEALTEAGKERLRPIIMTTFSMILGMMPLALSNSQGSEFKNGMAWVLIGGLTSSLLFTLFLVPSVYLVVDKLIDRFGKKKSGEVSEGDNSTIVLDGGNA
jgi:HAE1 family hydrophobic/amphiphilic exporter-1